VDAILTKADGVTFLLLAAFFVCLSLLPDDGFSLSCGQAEFEKCFSSADMAIYDKLKAILPDNGEFSDTMNFRYPGASKPNGGK